jgi:hypothetical protein
MHTVHNARINLLATAVNNLALAFAIAGFVAPLTGGQLLGGGRVPVALAWIGFGIVLHGCGQLVLGGLRQ